VGKRDDLVALPGELLRGGPGIRAGRPKWQNDAQRGQQDTQGVFHGWECGPIASPSPSPKQVRQLSCRVRDIIHVIPRSICICGFGPTRSPARGRPWRELRHAVGLDLQRLGRLGSRPDRASGEADPGKQQADASSSWHGVTVISWEPGPRPDGNRPPRERLRQARGTIHAGARREAARPVSRSSPGSLASRTAGSPCTS